MVEDIMLDQDGNFVAAADGDMETVRDNECLVQDLQHEAMTFPGDVWYDLTYGLGLQRYIKREDTELNRLELAQDIKVGFEKDSRVQKESVRTTVQTWALDAIKVQASFRPDSAAMEEWDGIPEEDASIIITIGQNGISLGGEAV